VTPERFARLGGDAGGFCLLEALVAAALLASALAALAQVFGIGLHAGAETRTITSEIVLATQTLEVFRAASHEEQAPGEFVDYLDAAGRATDDIASEGRPAFVRRISIEPLEWDPENTVVIRVGVARYPRTMPAADDVSLATLKTRK
jgi:hypothetical protein